MWTVIDVSVDLVTDDGGATAGHLVNGWQRAKMVGSAMTICQFGADSSRILHPPRMVTRHLHQGVCGVRILGRASASSRGR